MLLEKPKATTLTAVTLAAIAFSAGVYAIMGFINNGLLPHTIIDLEFAASTARLAELVAVWGAAGVESARQSLTLDFVFIPCYVLVFSGLALIVTRAATGVWQRYGLYTIGLPVLAGGLDVIENLVLLNSLPPATGEALMVAAVCAGLKFALLAVTLLYVVAALGWKVLTR